MQNARHHNRLRGSTLEPQQIAEWLSTLPQNIVDNSKPLQRVKTATHLLEMRSCRDQRKKIQPILDDWNVVQKHKGQKRKFQDVKADLLAALVQETKRLQAMLKATSESQTASQDIVRRGHFSAIQESLLRNQPGS